jgi:hypothetical protein
MTNTFLNSSSQESGLPNPSLINQSQFEESTRANLGHGNSIYDQHPISSTSFPTFLDYQDFSYLPTNPHFSTGVHHVPLDSQFSQDLNFGLWDLDLDSVELSYLDFDDVQIEQANPPSSMAAPESGRKEVSKRYAAFERSPWLWTPTEKDQALNDQQNLNVDEDTIPAVLTPASSPPMPRSEEFASCCIGYRQRDQMLSMVLTVHKFLRQAPRFPSLSLLNSIIQVYFDQERLLMDGLIHTGTFSPSKTLPQLLLAIVSGGATLISTPAIWKMGLALQEVVRHAVADYVCHPCLQLVEPTC